MKKYLKFAFVAAFAAIAGYGVYASQKTDAMSNLTLANVEAVAGCEVSSNASNNKGYCSAVHGGSGDACVSTGSGSEPRCSGNR